MNSLHPAFAFATSGSSSSSCSLQSDGKTWHCFAPGSPLLGVGSTKAQAQADLDNKLGAAKKKVVSQPKAIPQRHPHVRHHFNQQKNTAVKVVQSNTHGGNNFLSTKTVNGHTTVTTNHPENTKIVTSPNGQPVTVKPVQTDFLKQALETGKQLSKPPKTKPSPTVGTAAVGTGGNAIKQNQNKNQQKVITTSSPSSPIVNDMPSTSTPDTTTQDNITSPPPTPPQTTGNTTSTLLIGGAIFAGLIVLLLIV